MLEGIGLELELSILLCLVIVGASVFAAFEVETPAWRKLLKWTIVVGMTLGLTALMGHWAALVPLGFALIGSAVHVIWCRKHDIHPVRATPRRRYYELRGWQWHE